MKCKNCDREIEYAAVCPYCGTRMLSEPLPHHLPPGAVIDNRYTIVGVLGEGGFGVTYLGFNTRLNMPVAIKEYYPQGVTYRNTTGSNEVYVSSQESAEFFSHGRERFLREAKTLVRFNAEPGIVSIIDFAEENNTAYLIMEYLEGETLQEYLRKHGPMTPYEAFTMLDPMMRTLEKIHAAGVIHRDISPDNIMRLNNGQLKLMDFGAARDFVDENRSMSVMLKKGFAPAEQYKRRGEQGPWTDVYGLCATIYRCITGTTPIDALDRLTGEELPTPSSLGTPISTEMENILMYGLALKKEHRCQSMTELLMLIDQAKRDGADKNQAHAESYWTNRKPQANLPAQNIEAVRGNNANIVPDYVSDYTPSRNEIHTVPVNVQPTPQITYPKPPISVDYTEKQRRNKKAIIIAAISIVLALSVAVTGIVLWTNRNNGNTQNNGLQVSTEENTETTDALIGNSGDIMTVSAGEYHTVGLKNDGTVVAIGKNSFDQCEVEGWSDIVSISAGSDFTVGLKDDGTVVAVGSNTSGKHDVDDWTDIAAISAVYYHTVGLKNDGTVIAVGSNTKLGTVDGRCDVDDWKDITVVAAGYYHTVGVKNDGTAVATGDNEEGQCNVSSWSDLVDVQCGYQHTVGLRKDGTVVATGYNSVGQCDVENWTDIVAVSAGFMHTVGLRKDGTVVATGATYDGRCDVEDWTDIVAVAAGEEFSVGLKADGTLVTTGKNDFGQCNISGWNLR